VKGPIRTPSVVLARRAQLQQTGGLDSTPDAAEGPDLWLWLALLSPPLALPGPLLQRRRHVHSHSRCGLVHAGHAAPLAGLGRQARLAHLWRLRQKRPLRPHVPAGLAARRRLPGAP
jgi:hypothetical protein